MIEASNPQTVQKQPATLAPSHLPRVFILFISALIVMSLLLTLIGQPVDYWVDFSRATSSSPLERSLLAIHPLLFAGLGIVFMIFLNWFLAKLPRFVGLIVWIPLSYIYLRHAFLAISDDLIRLIPHNSAASYALNVGTFAIFSGIAGVLVATLIPSSKNEGDEITNKTKFLPRLGTWAISFLVLGWLLFLSFGLVNAIKLPYDGWVPVGMETRPSPRSLVEISYDFNRGRAIMFGGQIYNADRTDWVNLNETWEWDGNNWIQQHPENNPPARIKHAMAFDANRGVVVLYGGNTINGDLGDTWEWDGQEWAEKHPQTSPPARCCHSMAFDKQRGKVIAYGGTYMQEGWEWDGDNWSQIHFENESPYLSGSTIAYHDQLHYVMKFPNWILQGNEWSELQLDFSPPYRRHEGFVYAPNEEQFVLFGGLENEIYANDTWVWNGEVWQEVNSPLLPPARWGHEIFYDAVRERVILFGGFSDQPLNDMWELSLPNE